MKLKHWFDNYISFSTKQNRGRGSVNSEIDRSNGKKGKLKDQVIETDSFVTFPRYNKCPPIGGCSLLSSQNGAEKVNSYKVKANPKVRKQLKDSNIFKTSRINPHNPDVSLYEKTEERSGLLQPPDASRKPSLRQGIRDAKMAKLGAFGSYPIDDVVHINDQGCPNDIYFSSNNVSGSKIVSTNSWLNNPPELACTSSFRTDSYSCGNGASFDPGCEHGENLKNFFLPNFSYDSSALHFDNSSDMDATGFYDGRTSYTSRGMTVPTNFTKKCEAKRRLMIKTNPWFHYNSRQDTSASFLSDESFNDVRYAHHYDYRLDDTRLDDTDFLLNGITIPVPSQNTHSQTSPNSGRAKPWTSTLKEGLTGSYMATSNGDSGYYEDIKCLARPVRSTESYGNGISLERISESLIKKGSSINSESYSNGRGNRGKEDSFYSTLYGDSGCSNDTSSWSPRSSSSTTSSSYEVPDYEPAERSFLDGTSHSFLPDVGNETGLRMVLGRDSKDQIDGKMDHWERNQRELVRKLNAYRSKIKENNNFIRAKDRDEKPKIYGRRAMIYEIDPMIYI